MNKEELYNKNYKKLLVIPLILITISAIIILNYYKENNDFLKKDVSLKGGVSATVYTEKEIDIKELEKFLNDKFGDASVRKLSEFGSNKQIGVIIEISKVIELKEILEKKLDIRLNDNNFSIEEVGSSLGESFYKQMIIAMGLAFLFMALVVLIIFRTIVPSIAVISSAFMDIFVTVGIIDLIDLRVSTAGIAALLLLIGYSVDTDILLTTRVLKRREGTINQNIISSLKTGLTMTATTIVAVSIGYVISNSYILKEMFLIIIIGLMVDVIATYIMNASILKWYMEKKND